MLHLSDHSMMTGLMNAGKRGQAIQAIQATLPEAPAAKDPSKNAIQGVQAPHVISL